MNNPLTIDFRLRREFIDKLIDIDRDVYQQEPHQNQLLIAERRPELYTVIRRGDNIVGYGLVLPLRKAAFKALGKGRMWEDEITLDCITDRAAGFYIASIAAKSDSSERERAMIVGSTISPPLRTPVETIAIPISEAGDRICRNLLRFVSLGQRTDLKGIGNFTPAVYTSREEPNETA